MSDVHYLHAEVERLSHENAALRAAMSNGRNEHGARIWRITDEGRRVLASTTGRLSPSTEGASAPVSLQTTEEPMCPSDASTPAKPS